MEMDENMFGPTTAISPSQDVKQSIGDKFIIPESRTDITDWYFDRDIALKCYLFKVQFTEKEPESFAKFTKKWAIAQDSERWDYFDIPVVLYNLSKPCSITSDVVDEERSTQHCAHMVLDDHRDVDIRYTEDNTKEVLYEAPTPKRFHIHSQIYTTRKQFEINNGKIEDFCTSMLKPEKSFSIYLDCKRYLKRFVDAKDFTFPITGLWSMGTYLYSIFYRYPILLFHAPTGSGKTRYIKSILAISQRGRLLTNPTLASLFRTVHGKGMTLGLDENENQTKKDHLDMLSYLNNTFEKGGHVDRCRQRGNNSPYEVESFEGYCPKLLGTTESTVTTLGNRCFRIPLIRTRNEKYANEDPDEKEGMELRWRLEKWALSVGSEVYLRNQSKESYNQKYKDLFSDPELPNISPRFRSLLNPIFIVADIVGIHDHPDEMELIRKFIKHQTRHLDDKTVPAKDRRILLAFYEVIIGKKGIDSPDEICAYPGEIQEALIDQTTTEIEPYNTSQIGKVISKYDGIKKTHTRKSQIYFTTITELQDIFERYGIDYDKRGGD